MTFEAIETVTLDNGRRIEIHYDPDAESPREWDNLGTFVLSRGRYSLPNELEGFDFDEYGSWDEVREALVSEHHAEIILPVYCYDHSGVVYRTEPFSCPWDSGQVGFVFVTAEKLAAEYGPEWSTDDSRKLATECLSGEVETFSQWANGEVYGYVITEPDGEESESCWGFFGFDYCLSEAKAAAES